MSKSLFEFSKVKINEKPKQQQILKEENIESMAKNYAGKSQNELMDLFKQEVAKQKQDGTFDVEKLEKSIDALGPLISPEQKKNIKELLNQVR